jgi:hypothetical protein
VRPHITVASTVEEVGELGIAEDSSVRALVKSTEVALAIGQVEGLSPAIAFRAPSPAAPPAAR